MFKSKCIILCGFLIISSLHFCISFLFEVLCLLRVFGPFLFSFLNIHLECLEVWIILWQNWLFLLLFLRILNKIFPFSVVIDRTFFPKGSLCFLKHFPFLPLFFPTLFIVFIVFNHVLKLSLPLLQSHCRSLAFQTSWCLKLILFVASPTEMRKVFADSFSISSSYFCLVGLSLTLCFELLFSSFIFLSLLCVFIKLFRRESIFS